MKRLFIAFFGLVLATQLGVPSAQAAVNDFVISNYAINYYLSKDGSNRSQLKTEEVITAEFPSYDQNHGIERAIPQSYDGHSTGLTIDSVTNPDGASLPYTTYTSNDNLVVRIGDKDKYVHGPTTYKITYTQHDVTRYFTDTQSDEFYWDTNGTEWTVPIQNLSVRLYIDDQLARSLSGQSACYIGGAGATNACQVQRTAESPISVAASNLAVRENVTLAVGFKPGTFAAYEPTLLEKLAGLWVTMQMVASVLGIGLIIWLIIRWSRWSSRKKDLGTIVPEYLPPKDTSVTTSASLVSTPVAVFTAQLLDFAVRHYIKIYETKPKGFWTQAQYDIEIVKDINDLLDEEKEIFKDIFSDTAVGTRLALKSLQNNTGVYMNMSDNHQKLKKLMRGKYELRFKDEVKSAWFKKVGRVLLVLAAVLLSPALLVAAIAAFICGYTLWPLTYKGLALKRYLSGLKQYIEVAETERLKMLQSPEGAEKVGVDPNDPAKLVKLYERVLPYAVLFNQEKEWNKQIGSYYESAGSSPEWYSGRTAFNAAMFSSAMTSFSNSASYTSASSSTSGGSSGGGSSGGGGGGGGGGGW